MKTTVKAINETEAVEVVKMNIKIHKVEQDIDFLKNIFNIK